MWRFAYLLALLLLPLSEGGNGSWGLALGLVVIPLIAAVELWQGRLRLRNWGFVLFGLFAVISLLATTYLYPTFKFALWLSAAAFAYSLTLGYLRRKELSGSDVCIALSTGALLTALYGLWVYSPNFAHITPDQHLSATFGLHNSYAAFLLLTWPLSALMVRRDRGHQFILITAVLLVALLLAFSRGAYIALALQGVVLALWAAGDALSRRRPQAAPEKPKARPGGLISAIGITAALGLFLAFTGFYSGLAARIASIWNAADYSLQGRLTFWEVAHAMFRHFPAFGVGLGNFGYHYTYLQPDWRYYSTDAHGVWAKLLSETGVWGTLFALVALAVWAVGLMRARRNVPPGNVWAHRMLLVALIGFGAHAMVDFDFAYLANLLYFAVVAALVVAPAATSPQPSTNGMKLPTRWFALAGLLVAVPGLMYAAERAKLDRHNAGDETALMAAERIAPFNAATKIKLALGAMGGEPPDFTYAAAKASEAAGWNPYESQAYFIQAQCPVQPLKERIALGAKAIELDPFNRPHYYWGQGRLLHEAGDRAGERSVLLSAVQHFADITEPITPSFPRPQWIQNNITFASIYLRLAELLKDDKPEEAGLYARIGRRFLNASKKHAAPANE